MAKEEAPQAGTVISRDLGSQLIFVSAEPALVSQRGWEFLGSPPPLHCCLHPGLRGAKRESRSTTRPRLREGENRPEAMLGRRKDFTNKLREQAIRHGARGHLEQTDFLEQAVTDQGLGERRKETWKQGRPVTK